MQPGLLTAHQELLHAGRLTSQPVAEHADRPGCLTHSKPVQVMHHEVVGRKHQRADDDLCVHLDSRELSEVLFRSGSVGRSCFLHRVETPEVDRPPLHLDGRLILFAIRFIADAFDTEAIVAAYFSVPLILSSCGYTQVAPAIIDSITVVVIYLPTRPAASHQYVSQAACWISCAVEHNVPIARITPDRSSLRARRDMTVRPSAPYNPPRQDACFRVIAQELTDIGRPNMLLDTFSHPAIISDFCRRTKA